MKINYIVKILVMGMLVTAVQSCDDFLDKSPNGVLSNSTFYQTEKDAIAAANACYTILGDFWLKNIAFEKDIISDDAVKGQGVDLSALTNIENLNAFPSDGVIGALWGNFYRGIQKCNLVLDYVPDINMDEATKKRVLGEASFLRAFYYYNLAIRWGGVPLVTSTLNTDQMPARSTIEETWKQIENDLLQAASLLPSKRELSNENKGRADKGAARALLGNVYLFQQKWQAAFDSFDAVIKSGDYSLQPNFGDLFKPEFDNGVEVVFETQFKGGESFDFANGFNFWVRPRNGSTIFGLGFCMPTADLVNEFEPGDPRLKYTVIRQGDIISDEVKDNPFQAVWAAETGMNCGKYVVGIPVGNNAERHEQNQKQLRYAEVLLGYAEAAINLGKKAEAVEKINAVRLRARGGNPSVLPDVKTTDNLMAALIHEKRVELALEGKRYFDLVRWGLAEQELAAKGYKPVRKGLYPIPQVELDVNPSIVQNPGY